VVYEQLLTVETPIFGWEKKIRSVIVVEAIKWFIFRGFFHYLVLRYAIVAVS
jgi:hypothetical protein